MTVAAGVARDAGVAEASLLDALAAALEANRQLAEAAGELREENARLREENARLLERDAERDAELDRMRADLAVLQRTLFGRSSERSRPGPGLAVMTPTGAGSRARTAGAARAPGGVRGRGRDGGITRICPGLRSSGIFPGAGTAARSAGSRSRCWAITCLSSWTGW